MKVEQHSGGLMSEEGQRFLRESGASGALRFEWTDPTCSDVCIREFEQPIVLIGRDHSADLVLDDPSVEPFHAFLQVVDGRLFAFDLNTTTGIRWGEIPRDLGWLKRGERLRVGHSIVRLIGGDREEAESIVEPAPTSSRYVSRVKLPQLILEFRLAAEGKTGKSKREILDRVLVLAGNSDRCKLRFDGPGVSNFTSTLLRTPTGLWLSNIHPGVGARVNGAHCRFARIEDEDVLELGPYRIRINYNDALPMKVSSGSGITPTASAASLIQSRAQPQIAISSEDSSPQVLLQSLVEQAGSEASSSSSPFGQALIMLVRLLGDVHRDNLAVVRDELAEIRRLSRDMEQLRQQLTVPESRGLSAPQNVQARETELEAATETQAVFDDSVRPDPLVVGEIVGERLEAWERERHGRLRKLLRLLTGT